MPRLQAGKVEGSRLGKLPDQLSGLPGVDGQLVRIRMLHFRKLPHQRRVLAELLGGPQYDFMRDLA